MTPMANLSPTVKLAILAAIGPIVVMCFLAGFSLAGTIMLLTSVALIGAIIYLVITRSSGILRRRLFFAFGAGALLILLLVPVVQNDGERLVSQIIMWLGMTVLAGLLMHFYEKTSAEG